MLLFVPAVTYPTSAKVQTRYLAHTPEQAAFVARLYSEGRFNHYAFLKGDVDSQQRAQELLSQLGLDHQSRSLLESRWNIQWSNSWADGADSRRRILFQCSCGYHPQARQDRETKKQAPATIKSWERRVPFDFTGCTAHIEIVERSSDGEITRITGAFEHNAECQAAILKRLPAVPLHEHVYEVALEQMEGGANITSIQTRNREMMENQQYKGMSTINPTIANVRYHLLPTDHATLYRKFSRRLGVDVRKQPQYNIHDWLDPSSPSFKPEVHEAIFHYSGRSEAGERFKVCVATPQMKEAAWKYVHCSQLVLDGTFGICSVRLLLFIALGKDDDGKGVPVAFFLFSAPTGNKATHAGYNTEILRELLSYWRQFMGTGSDKKGFTPYVAITDTDTKERGALLSVWPEICLLLCRFHLRQCWTNHRKAGLKSKGNEFWKDWVLNALRSLEVLLLATVDHNVARDLIARQQVVFEQLCADPSADSYQHARSGRKHLDYLTENWMPLALWQSWSEFGRVSASALLKIPVEGVIPTTNHLESFNGLLKRKHLATWLRSGHRLRFDFLISLLITKILPGVYSHRKAQQKYKDWLANRFKDQAGGANLTEIHATLARERKAQRDAPITWWNVDPVRDASAEHLVQYRHLVVSQASPGIYRAVCQSTAPINAIQLAPPATYSIELCQSGNSSCSCPDFQTRGGACKHLRALRLIVDSWVQQGVEKPFTYPRSHVEAALLQANAPSPIVEQTQMTDVSVPPPTLTPAAPVLWDSTFVQSLGGDSTTIDDQDITEPTEAASNPNSNSDSDREHDSPPSGSLQRESPTIRHQSAVATQVQQRLKYELRRLLPPLHGLANLLTETSVQDPIPELQELSDLLTEMNISVDRITTSTASGHTPQTSSQQTLDLPSITPAIPIRTRPGKRSRRPFLLPPSPERRQKRKDSHAPL